MAPAEQSYATVAIEGTDHVRVVHAEIEGSALVPVDALEHYQERGWTVAAADPDAGDGLTPNQDPTVGPPVVAPVEPAPSAETTDTTAGDAATADASTTTSTRKNR